MKIKTISIIALAATVAFACKPETDFVPVAPVQEGEQITITASSEGNPTKTVLQSDGSSIWWQADDSINLFYGPSVGGAKFDNTATEPSAVTTFTGILNSVVGASEGAAAANKKFWGVYPYDAATELTANDEIKMALMLGKQMTKEGTFAPAAFPSIACADNLTLKFYNVCGALAIDVEEEGVSSIILKGNNGEILNGDAVITLVDGKPSVAPLTAGEEVLALYPDNETGVFEKGKTYYMAVLPTTFSKGVTITLQKNAGEPVVLYTDKELKIERNKTNAVTAKNKALTIKTVWLKQSGSSAWNTYFGGTAGSDRNIAMDDEYVYIAESTATAKLWAISISDPSVVKEVNVEGVEGGGAHALTCPRVVKNTDANVNGGKDVLICCSLTRGGVDPKLYMWNNGIDSAPKAITLKTWATGAWYGDTFTVFGTLQDGVLFFDKTGGENANGVVTFVLKGVPGDTMSLLGRLKFVDKLGSHGGVCAYYPYPDNINTGVYSPGRGVEARGQNVVATGNLKGEGGFDVTLTPLDYDEGTNGYVLGYNFIEWHGKRYVIYGNQSSNKVGYVRVRQGELTDSWANIASLGTRLYRRDLQGADGCTLTSGNSAMDITARVIDGDLYFAAQKQNIACGVYKLCYE